MSTAIKQLVTIKLIIISYRGGPGEGWLKFGAALCNGRAPSIGTLTLNAPKGTHHEGSQFS